MRLLLTVLITFFTWTALANNIIAKYDYGVSTSFNEPGVSVKSTLTDNGDLTIEVFQNLLKLNPAARPSADQLIVAQISEKNLEVLTRMTDSLLDAEVVNVTHQIICMMLPPFSAHSNHLYLNNSSSNGNLKLVLGPEGCWVSNRTSFKNDWNNKEARRIKAYLEILVNEYAGHLL